MSDTATPAAPEVPAEASVPAEGAATTAPTEATPPAKPEAVSPRLAALMKQEAKLREEKAALDKARAERDAWQKEREEHERLKKENPLEFLKAQGLTYEQLTELALNGGAVPPEKKTAAEVEELRQQLASLKEEREKERKALEDKAAAAQVESFWKDARATLEKEGEKYELALTHPDGWDTIQAVISAHARETGEVMSVTEAAEKVQAAFETQLAPVLSSKWASAKLAAVAPKQPAQSAESESGPRRVVRTLSNAHATAPAPPRAPSRDELRAAAIRLLESRDAKRS